MTPNEQTKAHNEPQLAALQQLEARCAWYVGEQLGCDPTLSERGRRLIREKMAEVILQGMGEWLAREGK